MLSGTANWLAFVKTYYTKLIINFTDAFLDPSIMATSTDIMKAPSAEMQEEFLSQAANGRESMTHKWFSTNSPDNICDGTYYCLPSNPTAAGYREVGYWSNTYSDGSNNLSVTDPLTITYTKRGVGSYLIAFDDKTDLYGVDFTVKFYSGVSLVYTSAVTNNNNARVSVTVPFQDDITSVVLTVTKLNKPNAPLRVAEFTTAVIKEYNNSTVISFNAIEQREVSPNNSIPQGNIASSELSWEMVNVNREFDFNNEDSRLHGFVKNNAKVEMFIGTKNAGGTIEYVPIFSGYSKKFSVPEESLVVSGSARDRLDVLRQSKITNSTIELNRSFEWWFKWILNNAGVADVSFNIDSSFTAKIVPVGWLEQVSHKFALEQVARGCSAVVYQDRLGIIQVKPLTSYPATIQETYTRSNYTHKDNQPIFENIANMVSVQTQPLVLVEDVEVYRTNENEQETAPASSTYTYTVFASKSPVIDQVVTIDPPVAGLTVDSWSQYSWGSSVVVTSTNGTPTDFRFKVIADYYEVQGSQIVQKIDVTSINENGEQELIWDTSPFLQTKEEAENIATNILARFKDPQKDVQLTLTNSGNPLLELGDRFNLTDLYKTVGYNIIEQDISFNGTYQHTIKGVK